MAWVIVGLLIVALLVLIYFSYVHFRTRKLLLKRFRDSNTITFGPKGSGKDLLFQFIINERRESYRSNIDYGHLKPEKRVWRKRRKVDKVWKCLNPAVTFKELSDSIAPNDYESFILGNVVKCVNPFEDNHDFYFSDCGIILPSQYDSFLSKQFRSLPVVYALSRHLWNCNIHINTQAFSRPWIKLREQADFFVRCRGVLNLPFFLLVRVVMYDKYESASRSLEPLRVRAINGFSHANSDLRSADDGLIKGGFVFVRKSKVFYDTRAFRKILFK
jgi:hypothetical protein